jgi:hypothetical protein
MLFFKIPARVFGSQQQHSANADAVNRGQHRRAGAELLARHLNGANERNNSCEMRERRQEMCVVLLSDFTNYGPYYINSEFQNVRLMCYFVISSLQ